MIPRYAADGSNHKTDASKSYIDWAVQHDFGVIDVNVPKHITDPQVRYIPCIVSPLFGVHTQDNRIAVVTF